MRLLFGHDAEVARWVAERIPGLDSFGECAGIGVIDATGSLVGGVIFHEYQPQWKNISVSFAADRPDWLTPKLVRAILRYPFTQLGTERITCATPKRNRRARQFLTKFGFTVEGNVRRGFGDDDMIISGLLRSEWEDHRFNGKISRSSASRSRSDAACERAIDG